MTRGIGDSVGNTAALSRISLDRQEAERDRIRGIGGNAVEFALDMMRLQDDAMASVMSAFDSLQEDLNRPQLPVFIGTAHRSGNAFFGLIRGEYWEDENRVFSDADIARATRAGDQMSWVHFAWRDRADLRYSVRMIGTPGHFYDFSDKTFKSDPTAPRARLTPVDVLDGTDAGIVVYRAMIGPSSGIAGEYQVTIRDMDAPDDVVAMLRVNFVPGQIWSGPPGTDDMQWVAPEAGLPPLGAPKRRRQRSIEIDGEVNDAAAGSE